MTCRELGGACEVEFKANTFEEIAALSKQHGKEMLQQKDPKHLKAMEAMQAQMQSPEAMKSWMDQMRLLFENR